MKYIGKFRDKQDVLHTITITTKDTEHYKPSLEYRYLPIDEKEKYYTVQVNDVVIFGEVDDVATTRRELDALLEEKYNISVLVMQIRVTFIIN